MLRAFDQSMHAAIRFMEQLPSLLVGFLIALIVMALIRAVIRAMIFSIIEGPDGKIFLAVLEFIFALVVIFKVNHQPAALFAIIGWCAGLVYAMMPGNTKNLL